MSNVENAAAAAAQGHFNGNTIISSGPKSYPKPEADYQEILQNPDVFLQKLQSFHSYFASKFKIPKLGGKALNLHQLFLEVTSRGGIEKVIRDRRWKEVTGAFKFPSSITSASFVLRKYYLSILYHFEQVYYFRKEEPSTSLAGAESASGCLNGKTVSKALSDGPARDQHSEISHLGAGSLVTGTIEAKCDYGYLITVEFGSQKLNGVLYHVPAVIQTSQRPNTLSGHAPRKRRRRKLGQKDPSRSKPKSGYNFFFAEHYMRLKPSYQGQERAITKNIGVLWNRLSEAEKQVYQQKGLKDRERYRTQMLQYNNPSLH